MIKKILLSLIISSQALAGLAPTTSKISGDSANVTTFNYQFPNFAGTHTGATVSLGVLSAAGGGTGQSSLNSTVFTTLYETIATTGGDILYGGASGAPTRLANGSSGQVLTSGGGTAAPTWSSVLVNPLTTTGDLIYGVGATPTRLANGTTGQILMSTTSSAETWQTVSGNSTILKAPTYNQFLSTGSTTGYYFTVTSANATAGATYTNNAHTFTVVNTLTAGTTLFTSGALAPTGSGTLTKSGGTGDATITFGSATAMATYTPPTSPAPLFLKVRMVGGGSGGVGGGTSAGTVPVIGTGTVFSGGGVVLNGGGIGVWNSSVGSGGTVVTIGTAIGFSISGVNGNGWSNAGSTNLDSFAGGAGANAPYFGGSGPSTQAAAGGNAVANSGAGGGGGANPSGAINTAGGSGGASGAFADVIISPVPATIYYAVGSGGNGGGAGGGSGFAGGNGAAGQIDIEEHYQ